MMQYDFADKSSLMNDFDMAENIDSYPAYQQPHNIFKSTLPDSNMIPSSDIWQSSPLNSNTNYQSFYFPSSVDSKEYHTAENHHSNYSPSFDHSSTSRIDPYSYIFSNNYPTESYSAQTGYNSSPIESSAYFTPMDSYQNSHSIYTDPNTSLPSSSSLPWDFGENKTSTHDVTSTSNSSKQPCLVCQEESSGYHFGAHTCESCKAFYRRITKDSNIVIKHSCDIPLPNITKLNRKDCRACRKAKCDQVGMTIISKDRVSRTKSTSKSSLIPINNLLEQLGHDLTYHQLSASSALENLFHLLDLPSTISIHFDYHSLYMNAIQIWRNQYNHLSQILHHHHLASTDTFAVLLFLFYSLMFIKENHENKSTNHIQFDKLVNILQQEIHRITGIDHRLACRIQALFMKCYVTLAQYYPNSKNIYNSNYNSQSVLPYQQYSICH